MTVDVLRMFEKLAEHGTAPEEGCSLFGVGHEEAFEQLKSRYIIDRFSRGGSAEKLVIGPFGSGKTHFLRQLMEIGREHDCVTAEVKLNKNLDYAQGLVVYQEIARRLRAPKSDAEGLKSIILEAIRRIESQAESNGLSPEDVVTAWAAGMADQDFALPGFGRVINHAVKGRLAGNSEAFDLGVRWLAGEVTDRKLAKAVDGEFVTSAGVKIHAHNARLSLYKFIKQAGFQGTILGFDEAEQGLEVEKKKMGKIFSQLLAEINSIVDAKDSSALILYAITPDVMTKINLMTPMLKQRFADPGPGMGFFDGNVFAPQIDLTQRRSPIEELTSIGTRLVELFFDGVDDADRARREEAIAAVPEIAEEVDRNEPASSARRELVKRIAAPLVLSYRTVPGPAAVGLTPAPEAEV